MPTLISLKYMFIEVEPHAQKSKTNYHWTAFPFYNETARSHT
jgi:hypothetical protein